MLCFWYQWRMKLGNAEQPATGRLRRHLDSCERCRQMHETHASLARQLRGQAPQPVALPLGLRARIHSAVLRQARPAMRLTPALGGLAAAAAVLASALLLVHAWNRPPENPAPTVQAPPAAPTPVIASLPDESVLADPLDRAQEMAAAPIRRQVQQLTDRAKLAGLSMLNILPMDITGQAEK